MMQHQQDVIDISAWTGTWPYDLNGEVSLPRLAERFARVGISEALVSPLAAVFAPDTMPANRALLAGCGDASLPVRFHPAPVLNPRSPAWREDLAEVLDAGVHAIRLIPTWHVWEPGDAAASDLLRAAAEAGIVPIVQARMIDERALPVMAAQAIFDATSVAGWLGGMPEVRVAVAGLYRMELAPFADLAHVAVDLSFVESDDTLATALEFLPPGRILAGTHAPMHEPLAGVVKLPAEGPTAGAARQVARDSAREWFSLPVT
jgi:hypothetical protein